MDLLDLIEQWVKENPAYEVAVYRHLSPRPPLFLGTVEFKRVWGAVFYVNVDSVQEWETEGTIKAGDPLFFDKIREWVEKAVARMKREGDWARKDSVVEGEPI